ncbi:MAG TPA: hypothetical protein VN648_17690 [Candidatus Methylomirabilis sp.]|nr:hypothetical protein [Candidatus Methylomirabilis sp.]
MADIARLVALGASNLTRGFWSVVSVSRAAWGPEIQVLAALGRGRSYGAPSRLVVRRLPGILDSGLWRTLETLPKLPTRAVVTDVGNDIVYGFSAEQTLAWVEEALDRLQYVTRDIILTELPIANIQRLSHSRYLVCRSVLVPSCRLSLPQVMERAEAVNAGLTALATARGIRLFRLDPAWYGLDPIHIRRSCWQKAWQAILDAPGAADRGRCTLMEGLQLSLQAPERRWILGIEQFTPQSGMLLPSGGRIWLY